MLFMQRLCDDILSEYFQVLTSFSVISHVYSSIVTAESHFFLFNKSMLMVLLYFCLLLFLLLQSFFVI